jgi:hypothetical protein
MTNSNIIIHYKHIISTDNNFESFTIQLIVFCSDKTRGTSRPVLLIKYYLPVIFIAIFLFIIMQM